MIHVVRQGDSLAQALDANIGTTLIDATMQGASLANDLIVVRCDETGRFARS
jgi:hypothetical protein